MGQTKQAGLADMGRGYIGGAVMKSKLEQVVKVEMRTETRDRVLKSKTNTRIDGTITKEETIYRRTVTNAFALLACGHWRSNNGAQTDVRSAKRLMCWECQHAEKNSLTSE